MVLPQQAAGWQIKSALRRSPQGPWPRFGKSCGQGLTTLLWFILQVAYARRLMQACTDEQSMAKDKPLLHFCDLLLQVRPLHHAVRRCSLPLSC